MGLFNWFSNKGVSEIGRDISWNDIIGKVFRVTNFDRAGTVIDSEGKVKAKSKFKPYGYLLVDSPIIKESVRLPIVHKDDFLLVSSVYDDPQLSEQIENFELLVTYVPMNKLPGGLAGLTHALHYVITPLETIDYYYKIDALRDSTPNPEKLFIKFIWEGEIRVQINLNPDL